MPSYELALLLRVMPREEIVSTLRRTADAIFKKGGIITKIDNLGLQNTPYKVTAHGSSHRQANYFIINFDVTPPAISDLHEGFKRDVDILQRQIYKSESKFEPPKPQPECTLSEDLKPPPYRKSVQEMLEKQKKAARPKFKYNTGLDYYPFQK